MSFGEVELTEEAVEEYAMEVVPQWAEDPEHDNKSVNLAPPKNT